MDKENISWKLIDKYFKENPNNLVSHHLESYNSFINKGIGQVFRENNPIRFIEREDENNSLGKRNECQLYLGGKDGSKIYYGKPIIYDDHNAHFMFPNDARLRNMTYGVTIHYDVEVDFIYYEGDECTDCDIKYDNAEIQFALPTSNSPLHTFLLWFVVRLHLCAIDFQRLELLYYCLHIH